jgi:hypothetical protein
MISNPARREFRQSGRTGQARYRAVDAERAGMNRHGTLAASERPGERLQIVKISLEFRYRSGMFR